MIFRIVFLFLFLLIIEVYFFQVLKTLIKSKRILLLIEFVSMLFLSYIIYTVLQFDRSVGQTQQFMSGMGFLVIIYVPKLFLTLVLLSEDVFRLAAGTVNYFLNRDRKEEFLDSRRKFVSKVGLG